MIRINKVNKWFNRYKKNQIHVIDNTSLELDDTGLVALLGPSGSGKTTLLNVIGGLDKVRSGSIFINGKRITRLFQAPIDRIRNLNIGYIFQDYKLIDDMSVYDNVSIVLKMIGIKDKKEIDKRVCYVLDKVGMLRYKRRPCNMLSGGERQRVAIARAIVKNPSIIIADEPTGNLDSKNSIEIMNIIKAISRDKLVILVTHEANLAKFYASRIIELEDGKIINDYINDSGEDLDYEIANRLYLKDYTYHSNYNDHVDIYSNDINDLKVKIVFNKNNIYIKTFDNRKIEVIDDRSSIEMIDDYHKSLTRDDLDKYDFDYENIINNPRKLKYSSIFNPITFITNGFVKVINYSLLKKILLIGFFLSGFFILVGASNIVTSLTIDDSNFVNINRNYLLIDSKKINYNDYINYEKNLGADYIVPTDSIITLKMKCNEFYQTSRYTVNIQGSLFDINYINKGSIIKGRESTNNKEIYIDKLVLKKTLKDDNVKMLGFSKMSDFLEKNITINKMGDFKVVGIVDTGSPSIYMNRGDFVNIIYHTRNSEDEYIDSISMIEEESSFEYDDYNLYTSKIALKEGRWPTNDYEVIVNMEHKDEMKLNKEINKTINSHKLIVVGYYTSADSIDSYFVNNNMIKYKVITSSSDIAVFANDKDSILKNGRENFHINIKDSYSSSKDKYMREQRENIKTSLISSIVIIVISLIEILLMIRSSFLSRIKEVGIYRAIGVKKKDIYIMFSGEIFAITTIASVPGILLASYIMMLLSKISYFNIIINVPIIIVSIITVYIFNLVVGLIPVFNTIRKRPAEILSRTDI